MPRPERNVIGSGEAAWDGEVDSNFSIITETPFPIASYATTGNLPSASSYDDCLAHVQADDRLYISNGSIWELYDRQSALVADSTATDATQMATDFNTLLQALQDSSLMATS
jgi:hypothetical protein